MGSNTYNHYLENKAHNYFGDFTNLFSRCKGYKKLLKIREHWKPLDFIVFPFYPERQLKKYDPHRTGHTLLIL